ncbi:DUF4824 family protein [Steroidobacter sp. S1-65]|uniref:DUF4824 family protein n=1 Tax=Steroidobacter gossypii TaxID=2805490 RepID=A0ABS1WYJ2_9GAMM|nr:DUF4824 family protein [Steroidobacter gossypii]MBM0106007.1 DUF4824 family protein [Steroidobacter gossypii]
MKLQWSRTRALLTGAALIVVTNAVVLAGVAYNRSGEPEAVLRLTERELRLSYWSWPDNENSSIDLQLSWRVARTQQDERLGYLYGGLDWLQPAQLQELGFDVSGDMQSNEDAQRVSRQPSRRVWVALEYDGPAYQAALEQARAALERATALAQANAGEEEFEQRLRAAQAGLEREKRIDSRLFIVDVGLDPDALRARHPNRQQYVMVPGRLRVSIQGPEGQQRPVAHVFDLDVDAIRVPYDYRDIVEPLTRAADATYYDRREPRFQATVNFGRRFEPWIVEVQSLQATQP